jgi:hypothetical protein
MNLNNNNNKIKQSALCCIYCGKSYKTRINLEKHLILCEIYHKSKTKTNNYSNDDEMDVIPSQKHMYQIIVELTLKCNRLENKVNELSKNILQKNKKIDVLEFLKNEMYKPDLDFDNITEIVTVLQTDIDYLFNNSYLETINYILSRNIYSNDSKNPLVSFNEKKNIIYVYTQSKWIPVSRDNFIRFLNIIQIKISKALSEWRKINSQKLIESDAQNILYDKTFSKLMAVEFRTDSVYNKYYTNIYNKIKRFIGSIINIQIT